MRYCKDCIHMKRDIVAAKCNALTQRDFDRDDPVHGPQWTEIEEDCTDARGEGGECGPDAKLYEPKEHAPGWAEKRAEEERRSREWWIRVREDAEKRMAERRAAMPWWKRWINWNENC